MDRKRKQDFHCSSRTLRRRLKSAVDNELHFTSNTVTVQQVNLIQASNEVFSDTTFAAESSLNSDYDRSVGQAATLNLYTSSVPSFSNSGVDSNGIGFSLEDENTTAEALLNDHVDDYSSDADSDIDSNIENKPDIKDLLSVWAKTCKTPLSHLALLLDSLRIYFPDLPVDPRTILNTPRHSDIKRLPSGGEYLHMSLVDGLTNFLSNQPSLTDDVLHLQFNIDGLPLFKSSNLSLWPIQCLVKQVARCSPFFVGVYCGKEKPKSLDEFLQDFITELNSLQVNGLQHGDHHYSVVIHSFVCDAPARAFLKNTKMHSGYHSCEKCKQRGEYVGRVVFLETDAALRTDVAFDEMADENHHCGSTPLSQLGIGLVSQFGLDYMHLVCLGVVRRLLLYWKGPIGPLAVRLGYRNVDALSRILLSFVAFVPCEFARKPRAVSEVLRWKATEFRQFLLYTGPVALKNILSVERYNHFLDLSVAIRILSAKELAANFNDYANKLLIKFVKCSEAYYGKESCVYNVHNLIHLAGDVARFGPLDEFSCFPFENQLRHLKQLVRKPQHVLQQIHRRLAERQFTLQPPTSVRIVGVTCKSVHYRGPLHSFTSGQVTQYSKLLTDTFQFSMKEGNDCFSTKQGKIYKIRNIIVTSDRNDVFIICQQFINLENFFDTPLPSSSLAIFQTGNGHVLSKLISLPANVIFNKYVCLPYSNDKRVLLPFI